MAERIDILGVGVSAIDIPMALAVIDGWIRRREPNYVCARDMHGIMLCRRDPTLTRIHAGAGLVTPDGMSLVWVSRLRGRRQVCRVTGSDLMAAVCGQRVASGYRHFLYGGAPGVAARLAERLRARFPGIDIVGVHAPPMRPLSAQPDPEAMRLIAAARPDIVWVGLSTPKQEYWMAAHTGRVAAPVLVGVGSAFDFLSGIKRRAPLWMQRSGLEWLFRLLQEPKRLWRRYLVLAPRFVLLVALESLGLGRRRRPQRSR